MNVETAIVPANLQSYGIHFSIYYFDDKIACFWISGYIEVFKSYFAQKVCDHFYWTTTMNIEKIQHHIHELKLPAISWDTIQWLSDSLPLFHSLTPTLLMFNNAICRWPSCEVLREIAYILHELKQLHEYAFRHTVISIRLTHHLHLIMNAEEHLLITSLRASNVQAQRTDVGA